MPGREYNAWKDEVRSYRDKLEISEDSLTPAEYKKLLDEKWQQYAENPDFEEMQLASQKTLEGRKVFEQWMAYQGSSILLITAVNHSNSELQQELWLSPALAEFANSRQVDNKCKVISHVMENGIHSLWDLLPVILCHVLDSDYELFSEHKLSLSNKISGFNAQVEGKSVFMARIVN